MNHEGHEEVGGFQRVREAVVDVGIEPFDPKRPLGRHQPPIDSRIERPLAVVGRLLCHGVRARCRDGQHAPDDAAAQRPARNLMHALPHVCALPAARRRFTS